MQVLTESEFPHARKTLSLLYTNLLSTWFLHYHRKFNNKHCRMLLQNYFTNSKCQFIDALDSWELQTIYSFCYKSDMISLCGLIKEERFYVMVLFIWKHATELLHPSINFIKLLKQYIIIWDFQVSYWTNTIVSNLILK